MVHWNILFMSAAVFYVHSVQHSTQSGVSAVIQDVSACVCRVRGMKTRTLWDRTAWNNKTHPGANVLWHVVEELSWVSPIMHRDGNMLRPHFMTLSWYSTLKTILLQSCSPLSPVRYIRYTYIHTYTHNWCLVLPLILSSLNFFTRELWYSNSNCLFTCFFFSCCFLPLYK